MSLHGWIPHVVLFAATFVAGAVNSVAGGGTLLTFPALLALGVSPLGANATSTVALVPGSIAAAWGYRSELRTDRGWITTLLAPSLVGGIAGAWLAIRVGDAWFAALVPWLILAATVLFMLNERLAAWSRDAQPSDSPSVRARVGVALFQVVVGLYGGFFGAGIGIMMLAALGLVGMRDVYRMNGLKNLAAGAINLVASVLFILSHRVVVSLAVMMAVGAIAGGTLGVRVARRAGARTVRRLIVAIGFGIAAWMLLKRLHVG